MEIKTQNNNNNRYNNNNGWKSNNAVGSLLPLQHHQHNLLQL